MENGWPVVVVENALLSIHPFFRLFGERGSRNADPSVLFPHPISITTRYTEAMRFLGNVSSPDERVRGIHGCLRVGGWLEIIEPQLIQKKKVSWLKISKNYFLNNYCSNNIYSTVGEYDYFRI